MKTKLYLKKEKLRVSLRVCLLVSFLMLENSCGDFLETKAPNTQLVSSSVFNNDATATAATVALYEKIMENYFSVFNGQLTLCAGLSSDEMLNTSGTASLEEFATSSINSTNDQLRQNFWSVAYNYVYQANSIIEGVLRGGISRTVAAQLEGEARVMRAFAHFYLVNLFGDIPFVATTDYRQNSIALRTQASQVYEAITDDLKKAQGLLSEEYITMGRIRPNKAVATALLARVYLYRQDWSKAEEEATKVISNANYSLSADLTRVFLANSSESIWQMIPVLATQNTAEGNRFATTTTAPVYAEISANLMAAFESGDRRRANWTTQYTFSGRVYSVPFKYRVRTATVITENYTVLRLAEQYLIRAEARANQGKLTEAISDLDVIRNRAGLTLLRNTNPSITQPNLLLAIERERRIELLCEWGHRWLDLKRTSRVNAIMQAYRPATWNANDALYPIPRNETLVNVNLVQNPGY